MQGILRAAVDAPLPLEIEGRALPGHDDAQVGEALWEAKRCFELCVSSKMVAVVLLAS